MKIKNGRIGLDERIGIFMLNSNNGCISLIYCITSNACPLIYWTLTLIYNIIKLSLKTNYYISNANKHDIELTSDRNVDYDYLFLKWNDDRKGTSELNLIIAE